MSVERPAVRHRLAEVALHLDLALGDHAGGHVDDDRQLAAGRYAKRDRIGRHARLGTPEGHLQQPAAMVVAGYEANHVAGSGGLDVLAKPADVAAVEHLDHAHRRLPCLLDGQGHGLAGDRLAEAPLAVDQGRGRGFANHLDGDARYETALFQDAEVLGQARDAVGVVAHQVGEHQRSGDVPGLVGRQTRRAQQALRVGSQLIGSEGWHVSSGMVPERPRARSAFIPNRVTVQVA